MSKYIELNHGSKNLLTNAILATSITRISLGLMFSGRKKIEQGMCLVMPSNLDVRYGASVTMMFCFHSMDILFVNSKFKVVDKKTLKPWKMSYTPQEKCLYVIESWPGTFKDVNIGDKVKIIFK